MGRFSSYKMDGIRGRNSGDRSMGNLVNCFCRVILAIMAFVVVGYYGTDLNAARKAHKYADSKWVYAVVVGSMAAVTALTFAFLPWIGQYRACALLFPWEWIMFILWAALTGIFASMYINENPEMDSGVQAMKTASIFDIVNMVLWFIAAVTDTAVFFTGPRPSLHLGRTGADK